MSTNMTGFRRFSRFFVLWTKVASALEGLKLYTVVELLEWPRKRIHKLPLGDANGFELIHI